MLLNTPRYRQCQGQEAYPCMCKIGFLCEGPLPEYSVRNKDLEAGGPTENPVAKIDFFINHKD